MSSYQNGFLQSSTQSTLFGDSSDSHAEPHGSQQHRIERLIKEHLKYLKSWKPCLNPHPASRNIPLRGKLILTYGVMWSSFFLMIASCIVGRGIVTLKQNPMLGPPVEALVETGASRTSLIRGGEWWRLLWSPFLHAGWFHLIMNFILWFLLGDMIEPDWGFLRTGFVFMISAVSGNLLSATLDPFSVSVGASGGIFGVMGGCIPYIIEYWHTIPQPKFLLFAVLLSLGLGLACGFVPYVDNYAHLGGSVGGILAGLMTITDVQMGTEPPTLSTTVESPFNRSKNVEYSSGAVLAVRPTSSVDGKVHNNHISTKKGPANERVPRTPEELRCRFIDVKSVQEGKECLLDYRDMNVTCNWPNRNEIRKCKEPFERQFYADKGNGTAIPSHLSSCEKRHLVETDRHILKNMMHNTKVALSDDKELSALLEEMEDSCGSSNGERPLCNSFWKKTSLRRCNSEIVLPHDKKTTYREPPRRPGLLKCRMHFDSFAKEDQVTPTHQESRPPRNPDDNELLRSSFAPWKPPDIVRSVRGPECQFFRQQLVFSRLPNSIANSKVKEASTVEEKLTKRERQIQNYSDERSAAPQSLQVPVLEHFTEDDRTELTGVTPPRLQQLINGNSWKKNECQTEIFERLTLALSSGPKSKGSPSSRFVRFTGIRTTEIENLDDTFRWKSPKAWMLRILGFSGLVLLWSPLIYFLFICPECYTAPGQIISYNRNSVGAKRMLGPSVKTQIEVPTPSLRPTHNRKNHDVTNATRNDDASELIKGVIRNATAEKNGNDIEKQGAIPPPPKIGLTSDDDDDDDDDDDGQQHWMYGYGLPSSAHQRIASALSYLIKRNHTRQIEYMFTWTTIRSINSDNKYDVKLRV